MSDRVKDSSLVDGPLGPSVQTDTVVHRHVADEPFTSGVQNCYRCGLTLIDNRSAQFMQGDRPMYYPARTPVVVGILNDKAVFSYVATGTIGADEIPFCDDGLSQ